MNFKLGNETPRGLRSSRDSIYYSKPVNEAPELKPTFSLQLCIFGS